MADDLTGAGDAAVQFASVGWRTVLLLDADADLDAMAPAHDAATVFAVSTDSRALPDRNAAEVTAAAVSRLTRASIGRLFVKIDSTVRGSVAGQITGALDAWRARYPDARAVVCPAYPKMGRTVQDGRVLVNGEPVDQTVYGRDPVTPVHTSRMAELLASSPGVSSVDAITDDDLRSIATVISSSGPATIGVGSGGLAGALARAWTAGQRCPTIELTQQMPRRRDRICVQISSLNPIAHAQAARLRERYPEVRVLIGAAERMRGASVAEALAGELFATVAAGGCEMIGLVGGDGARAALGRLGASGIRIVSSIVEGVPLGVVIGGRAEGLLVFTKAGGFGDQRALVDVVDRIVA